MTGRPTKIDQVVAYIGRGDDRRGVTAADRIVESLRMGDYFETAAAAAGVTKETAYHWLRTGADANAQLNRANLHGRKPPRLTKFQDQCRSFSDAVAAATAEWHASALTTLELLGRGGMKVTKVSERTEVVRQPDGSTVEQVVERRTTTETLAPNAAVLMWRLTRRFPDRYGHRVELVPGNDLVVDPLDDPDLAGSLADQLAEFQRGAAAALEVRSRERSGPDAGA